jgi:hypothetical protein
MNFGRQLNFNTRMIPSAKQHALAWRMRRDTPWAHSDRGQNVMNGARDALALLTRSLREIPAKIADAWPQTDCAPRLRLCR